MSGGSDGFLISPSRGWIWGQLRLSRVGGTIHGSWGRWVLRGSGLGRKASKTAKTRETRLNALRPSGTVGRIPMLVSYTITPCNFVVTKSQRLTAFWLKALLSRSSRKLLEPDWGNRWPSWPRATYSNQVLITSSCAANSQRNCQPFDRPFLRRSAHGAAPAVHAVQRHAWVDLGAKTASSEGRYSPSMVRRAVSADTGFVQISALTQVIKT